MTEQRIKRKLSMDGPAIYRIHVRGRLHETWSGCLGGMEVVEYRGTGGQVETILQGEVLDQVALTGVLNTLCQLQLPVISAQYLEEDAPEDSMKETRP